MSELFDGLMPPSLPFALPEGMSAQVRWDATHGGHWIDLPDGTLFHASAFLPPELADRAMAYLLANRAGLDPLTTLWANFDLATLAAVPFTHVPWRQEHMPIHGRRVPLPRLTSWHGDPGAVYEYAGIRSAPQPWNAGLSHLLRRVEDVAGVRFNSVLLNWYRNGQDHMGWHADDEPELGPHPCIASLNLGATRDFVLRHNAAPHRKLTIALGHGSLLIMQGAMQHHWQHAVPKRLRVCGSRINLTFRRVGIGGAP